MLIKRPRGWELQDAAATPEAAVMGRRAVLQGFSVIGAGALASGFGLHRAQAEDADPTADLYPAKRNAKWVPGRDVTPEEFNLKYNNFYEFGSDKEIHDRAQALKVRPWTIKIGGLVEKPLEMQFDDLVRKMPLEERVVRHRCVEAWAMTVPWSGFPLAALVALAKPLGSAKYVRFETFLDPKMAPAQGLDFGYPWPYVEGLSIAEATHELSFIATGAYGKPLPKQMGAPLRLHTPWKYGFKSIKSITRIDFVEARPKSFWEAINANEYGFWANVNPAVTHPRWSQAQERLLGTGGLLGSETAPTLIYNGYGEWVASLYAGMDGEKLFM